MAMVQKRAENRHGRHGAHGVMGSFPGKAETSSWRLRRSEIRRTKVRMIPGHMGHQQPETMESHVSMVENDPQNPQIEHASW